MWITGFGVFTKLSPAGVVVTIETGSWRNIKSQASNIKSETKAPTEVRALIFLMKFNREVLQALIALLVFPAGS